MTTTTKTAGINFCTIVDGKIASLHRTSSAARKAAERNGGEALSTPVFPRGCAGYALRVGSPARADGGMALAR